MTMHKGDEGPVELTGKQSFVVGCGIGVVVLLLVGVVVVWQGKKIEAAKRATTERTLHIMGNAIRNCAQIPTANGSGSDWSGQEALRNLVPKSSNYSGPLREDEWAQYRQLQAEHGSLILDGWGNPIRYRYPGPVDMKGWDLWSCGPNGKDDQGTFDDILVGEDVAAVSSR